MCRCDVIWCVGCVEDFILASQLSALDKVRALARVPPALNAPARAPRNIKPYAPLNYAEHAAD